MLLGSLAIYPSSSIIAMLAASLLTNKPIRLIGKETKAAPCIIVTARGMTTCSPVTVFSNTFGNSAFQKGKRKRSKTGNRAIY